jgi:hypothetical protein
MGDVKIYDEFYCPYRGVYPIGVERVIFYDLLGLFRIPYRLSDEDTIQIVHPKVITLDDVPISENTTDMTTPFSKRKNTSATDFSEVRKYAVGDPIKHMHWKQTFRRQEFTLKVFDNNLNPHMLIAIDCKDHGKRGLDSYRLEDMMMECATAITKFGLEEGYSMDILATQKIPLDLMLDKPSDFSIAHGAYARVQFNGEIAVEEAIVQKMRRNQEAGIYCIASRTTPRLVQELYARRLQGKKVVFVLVVLEDESDSMMRAEINEMKAFGIHAALITPSEDTYEVLRRL